MRVRGHYKTDYDKLKAPGDFMFTGANCLPPGQVAGLLFVCPCGCEVKAGINFTDKHRGPVWAWDGNRRKPTVTPSIQRLDGCKWHGYLTEGVWIQC